MPKQAKVFIEKATKKGEGKIFPKAKAKISVDDVGLQRGFGVFETLRTYDGEVFQLDNHLQRLLNSAAGIGLDMPWDKGEFEKRIKVVLKKSEFEEQTIRVIVTGGQEQGLMEPADPTLIVICGPLHTYAGKLYKQGAKIVTFETDPFLPRVKSIDYLERFIAVKKARKRGAHEVLFCDKDACVLEGTTSNFFIIKDKKLITPEENILLGITRGFVLEIAEESKKLKVEERKLPLKEVYKADEAFLTSTGREIMPVVKINHQNVASGKPGKVTQALHKKFKKEIKRLRD